MSTQKQSTNKAESRYLSPSATGGIGYRFEWLVATSYVISLIRNEMPLGMNSLPEKVIQQSHNQGNSTDDIAVCGRMEDGLSQTLYLQAKHRLTFSNAESNHEFLKVISEAWKQIHSPKFTLNQDRIGFAISDISNTQNVKSSIQELLSLARSSQDGTDLFSKIHKSKNLTTNIGVFKTAIHKYIKRQPRKEETWCFLKHLYIIPFDFTYGVGFHFNHLRNACINAVSPDTPSNGQRLFDSLYNHVSEQASQNGTITRVSLKEHIPVSADHFTIPSLTEQSKTVQEKLADQLFRRIQSQKDNKKYIPDIYVEPDEIKEKARYFTDPQLFQYKLCREIDRISTFELNRLLKMIGFALIQIKSSSLATGNDILTIEKNSRLCSEYIHSIKERILKIKSEDFSKSVPADKKYIYKVIQDKLEWRTVEGIVKRLDSLDDLANTLRKRIWIITSKAGSGKTNFICDFAENNIQNKGIPVVFFLTSKDCMDKTLETAFCQTVIPYYCYNDIDTALKIFNDLGVKNDSISLVAIDALNEHRDTKAFVNELDVFFMKCMNYSNIRILATCRSEYFKERFSSLSCGSYRQHLVDHPRDFSLAVSEQNKQRLLKGYFNRFKIQYNHLSDLAFKELTDQPLLLRIFCEAFENQVMPHIDTVSKEQVFLKYDERKSKTYGGKHDTVREGNRLFSRSITSIVKRMVKDEKYLSISCQGFEIDNLSVIDEIIDEDVLLRKDIDGNDEFINFTYDAVRDYYIARNIIEDFTSSGDDQDFIDTVQRVTKNESPCAEGVQQFLFSISRNRSNKQAEVLLKTMAWYNQTLIGHVFDLKEEVLTQEDQTIIVGEINNTTIDRFDRQSFSKFRHLVSHLIWRYDKRKYPIFNLSFLVDIIANMSDENKIVFTNEMVDWGYDSPISLKRIEETIDHIIPDDEGHEQIYMLLLYLDSIIEDNRCSIGGLKEIVLKYEKNFPQLSKGVKRVFRQYKFSKPYRVNNGYLP